MARIRRLGLVALLGLFAALAGCKDSKPTQGGPAPQPEPSLTGEDPEAIKSLIPEAAGVPADALRELAAGNPTPDTLKSHRGETLLWWVFSHVPDPTTAQKPTSFRFLTDPLNPSAIAGAMAGPKDKDGNRRPYATVIHPEYITAFTCQPVADGATGTVAFKVDKVYEGIVEYTARQKDGKWRIEEFRLPDHKVTLVLGPDGKWVKK